MWYYLCIVIGAVVGWGMCALFSISAENKEIRRLREALQAAAAMSVSEYCHKYSVQNCHVCEKWSCGDNTNPEL